MSTRLLAGARRGSAGRRHAETKFSQALFALTWVSSKSICRSECWSADDAVKRLAILHIGAWITLALLWWQDGAIRYGGLTVLDWTFVVILAGCVQTMWIRLARILRSLRKEEAKPASARQSPGQ